MADWSKNYSHINWQNGQSPYLEAQNLNYDQGWIAELVDRTVELNDATLPAQELQGYVDEAEGYADSASTSADNASTSANNASTSADNASASATSAQASAEEAERQAHLSAGANAIDYDVDTSTLSLMHDSTVLDTTTIISGGGDIVTEWETTPSDEKVPSEKLVKESLESLNDDIVAKQTSIPKLTQTQYDTLISTGSVVVGGKTITYNANDIYEVDDGNTYPINGATVGYNNATSGLSATNVQDAIDEVNKTDILWSGNTATKSTAFSLAQSIRNYNFLAITYGTGTQLVTEVLDVSTIVNGNIRYLSTSLYISSKWYGMGFYLTFTDTSFTIGDVYAINFSSPTIRQIRGFN